MKCQQCKARAKVIDSRHTSDGARRRRYSCSCGLRFATCEFVVTGIKTKGPAPMAGRWLEQQRREAELCGANQSRARILEALGIDPSTIT